MSETVADSNRISIHWHAYKDIGSVLMLYVNHTQNPEDPQYTILRQQFNDWLMDNNKLIRCEGRVPDARYYTDEEAAIRSERSEMGLLALWSANHDIPMLSFEPPLSEQAAALMQLDYGSCQPDEYWFYLIARQIPQALRSLHAKGIQSPEEQAQSIRSYIDQTTTRIGKELGWQPADSTFDHFSRLAADYYPDQPLDILDYDFFWNETIGEIHNPNSRIQEVSHYANLHREAYTAQLLTEDMASGKNVFGMMGNPHATMMGGLGSYY